MSATENIGKLPATETTRLSTGQRSRWLLLTGVGALFLIGLLIADRWFQIDSFAAPSGADPGNWLSFAHEMSGRQTRLAAWAYPPLTLVILQGLLAVFEPLPALKILGLSAWAGMGLSFYLLLRLTVPKLPLYWHLGLATLFTLAGYQGEMFAWGGYPQLLGMAFMVWAIPATEIWLRRGSHVWAVVAVLSMLGVLLTHHLLAGLLPGLVILVTLWCILAAGSEKRLIIRRAAKLYLAAGSLIILVFPIYWGIVDKLVGSPINPNGFNPSTIPTMLEYVFRDSMPAWLGLIGLSIVAPFFQRKSHGSGSVFALTGGTLLIVTLLLEVRALQLLLASSLYGLAITCEYLWLDDNHDRQARITQGVLTLGLAAMVWAILPKSQQWFHAAVTTDYRIVDNDYLDGLLWLRQQTAPSDRVVATMTPGPEAWWIEGFAERQTFYATDTRWLAYQDERDYALVARQIFDPQTPVAQAAFYLDYYQIRWVFMDIKYGDQYQSPIIASGLLDIVYENNRIVILKTGMASR